MDEEMTKRTRSKICECGTIPGSTDKYCTDCGEAIVEEEYEDKAITYVDTYELQHKCEVCGRRQSLSSKFCGGCGSDELISAPPTPSQMYR